MFNGHIDRDIRFFIKLFVENDFWDNIDSKQKPIEVAIKYLELLERADILSKLNISEQEQSRFVHQYLVFGANKAQQKDLSAVVKVLRQAISLWCQGDYQLSVFLPVIKQQDKLDVPLGYFIGIPLNDLYYYSMQYLLQGRDKIEGVLPEKYIAIRCTSFFDKIKSNLEETKHLLSGDEFYKMIIDGIFYVYMEDSYLLRAKIMIISKQLKRIGETCYNKFLDVLTTKDYLFIRRCDKFIFIKQLISDLLCAHSKSYQGNVFFLKLMKIIGQLDLLTVNIETIIYMGTRDFCRFEK